MARNKGTKPTGADMRAMKAVRAAELADPTQEAQRHEASFLANLSRAQGDFEWLAEHHAWILLGFASLAEWWEGRVRPVLDALALRPAPEMAQRVVEMILAAEAELPAPQRRSKKELAALVGASEWKAYGREDHRQRRSTTRGDHEPVGVPDPRDTDQEESSIPPGASSTQTAAGPEVEVAPSPAVGDGAPTPSSGTGATVPAPDPADFPVAGSGATPEDSAAVPLVAAAAAESPEQRDSPETGDGASTASAVSGQNHPSATGEAPAGLLVQPASGAGEMPSDVGEASGEAAVEGSTLPEPSAVDLDEEPLIASPEELKNLIDEMLDVLDRRIEYAVLAPQYDEDSLTDLELQLDGFPRLAGLMRRWMEES